MMEIKSCVVLKATVNFAIACTDLFLSCVIWGFKCNEKSSNHSEERRGEEHITRAAELRWLIPMTLANMSQGRWGGGGFQDGGVMLKPEAILKMMLWNTGEVQGHKALAFGDDSYMWQESGGQANSLPYWTIPTGRKLRSAHAKKRKTAEKGFKEEYYKYPSQEFRNIAV